MTDNNSPNPLEDAIARVAANEAKQAPADEIVESSRAVLYALAMARVAVLTEEPATPGAPPETGTPMLFVSDGDNHEQPMLAIFTRTERAERFHEQEGGSFAHPAEVPAPWTLLQIPEDTGIMINPNLAPTFRVSPQVAGSLRAQTEEAIAQHKESDSPRLS